MSYGVADRHAAPYNTRWKCRGDGIGGTKPPGRPDGERSGRLPGGGVDRAVDIWGGFFTEKEGEGCWRGRRELEAKAGKTPKESVLMDGFIHLLTKFIFSFLSRKKAIIKFLIFASWKHGRFLNRCSSSINFLQVPETVES